MHSQASSSTQRRPTLTQCEDATSNLEPYVFLAKHPRRCSGRYFQGHRHLAYSGDRLLLRSGATAERASGRAAMSQSLGRLHVSSGVSLHLRADCHGSAPFFSLSVSWCVFRNRQALSMVEHDVRGHSRCEPSTISCPQEAVASSRDQPRQLARARGVYVALEQRRTRDNVVFAIGLRKIARS